MTEEDHNEDSAVRKDAPTLFGIAKHAPFVMEAGLFERFPHEVQALAIKQSGTPLSIWLKRVAIALPALALVLFVVHELRAPGSPVAYAPFTDDSLLFATSDPFDTRAILADATPEQWPVFDSITVQLTENEALAYIDQHDIDLAEYLY